MNTLLKSAAFVLAMAVSGTAQGATLGVATQGPDSVATGSFDHFAAFDELASLDTTFFSGPLDGTAALVFVSPGMPLNAIFDFGLSGVPSVLDVGFVDDTMEFLLDGFAGFTSGALVTLSGFGAAAGDNPFDFITAQGDFTYGNVTVTVTAVADPTVPAPVPLPAGMVLLASGLGAMGFSARRRR